MAADGAVGVSDGSRGDTNGQRAQTLLQLPLPEVDGPSRSLAPAAWSRCFWRQLWHVRRLILAVPVFLWSQGLVTHVNDNEGGGNTLSLEIHLYRFLSLSSNSTVVI